MDLGIKGKHALVVGGSRGVGLEVVKQLRQEGCNVGSISRTDPCDIRLDLMADGAIDELETVLRNYAPVDIIYYCIGGSWGDIKDWRADATDWAHVWLFNVGIAIELNRRLVPAMIERKWGRVVMTSTDGTKCNSGNPPYLASKTALEGYVASVSKQWSRHNVILTAVAPGHVHTPGRFMYEQPPEWTAEYMRHHCPIDRWARPDEISSVVTFLCSERASYMAGSIVRVDGGSR